MKILIAFVSEKESKTEEFSLISMTSFTHRTSENIETQKTTVETENGFMSLFILQTHQHLVFSDFENQTFKSATVISYSN